MSMTLSNRRMATIQLDEMELLALVDSLHYEHEDQGTYMRAIAKSLACRLRDSLEALENEGK